MSRFSYLVKKTKKEQQISSTKAVVNTFITNATVPVNHTKLENSQKKHQN